MFSQFFCLHDSSSDASMSDHFSCKRTKQCFSLVCRSSKTFETLSVRNHADTSAEEILHQQVEAGKKERKKRKTQYFSPFRCHSQGTTDMKGGNNGERKYAKRDQQGEVHGRLDLWQGSRLFRNWPPTCVVGTAWNVSFQLAIITHRFSPHAL